jgi:2-methylcitrate dehydratase PrpD
MTFVHTAWDYRPAGATAAQMNMFYGITVMALRGDVAARDYTEATIADPEILSFIPRIKVFVDDELEAMGPAFRHAARVTVRTASAHAIAREVLNRHGSPENPVTHEAVDASSPQISSASLTEKKSTAWIARARSRHARQCRRHPSDHRPGAPVHDNLVIGRKGCADFGSLGLT